MSRNGLGILMLRSYELVEAFKKSSSFRMLSVGEMSLGTVDEQDPVGEFASHTLGYSDGHAHRSRRRALVAPLQARQVEKLRDDISQLAIDHARNLTPGRDVIDVAEAYTGAVFSLIVGHDWPSLRNHASAVANVWSLAISEQREAIADALQALWPTALELLRNPETPITRSIARAELSEHEKVTRIIQLVVGGWETTSNQIALNEYTGRGEHLFDPLAVTPETAANTVHECLRIRSTVPGFTRVATRPMNIGGVDVAQGELVFGIVWTANLDPNAYTNPDLFLPQRWEHPATPEHVTFGLGVHRCVGRHLAVAEQAAFLAASARHRYTLPSAFEATSDQPLRPTNLIVGAPR